MEKLPFVPQAPTLSAEEVRHAIAGLRRFHLGDPQARAGAPAGTDQQQSDRQQSDRQQSDRQQSDRQHSERGPAAHGLLPALLHPYHDPQRIRSAFPVHVPHAPALSGSDAPLCVPIAELLGGALLQTVPSPDRARLIADNLIRAERAIRDRVAAAGGRVDAGEALDGVAAGMAEELDLGAEPAAQLRAQWDALRATIQDGEFLGLDRKTALHLLLAAARAVVPARRRAFRDEVVQLRDRLRDLLEVERRKDPEATAPDALQGAVGRAGAQLLDAAALAKVVGARPRGSVRLDPRRRARIEQALEVLDEHVDDEPWPLLTVVHGPGRDPGVVDRDLRLCPMDEPCAAAARLFDVEAERQAILFRAVRLARLEVDGAYDPERHDPWLEALEWQGFTDAELLLVPTFVALEAAAELAGERLGALSRLLCSGRPVQVLALATPVDLDPDDGSLPIYRLELGYLGVGHREAFVQQSTAARPAHLAEGFRCALTRPRAALHVVATGLDADDHAPAVGAYLFAGAAIDARAHPLFRYDPDAGATWARRLDFAGNPEVEDDWARGTLRFTGSQGAEQEAAVAFTFADFGLLDPALAAEYRPVPEGVDDPALVPVADALDSDGAHALPFVQGVDAERRLCRAVVSRRLLAAMRDRLDFWRTLQELSGVRNEHVREAVARARDEAAAAARAEREQLEAGHRAELEKVREDAVAGAMDGLARALLDLTPDALAMAGGAAAAPPRPSAGPVEPPAAAPEPSDGSGAAAAEVAPEPEADEAAFTEAWIDTPLCTSCNDCRNINPRLFVYDSNKQAMIGDPAAGTYRQLVTAAEKCPARCIHPGLPQDESEPDLDELIARARPFNR